MCTLLFLIFFHCHTGLAVPSGQQIRGMFLDITVDAPAKSLWLQIKQFNGYWGCSTCKEKGSQLVIGKGKKNRLSTLNINHHHMTFFQGKYYLNV